MASEYDLLGRVISPFLKETEPRELVICAGGLVVSLTGDVRYREPQLGWEVWVGRTK